MTISRFFHILTIWKQEDKSVYLLVVNLLVCCGFVLGFCITSLIFIYR